MKEQSVWGIHAGRTGDADSLFLKNNVVAIGWHEMGDMSKIPCDREMFKAAVANAYPHAKPGAVPNYAGQLLRFVCEMQTGDLVLYPSKQDRLIHFGRIQGGYVYSPQVSPGYPNQRTVKWVKAVPRTEFSQGALYELGSAMSLFQVKTYADEYRAVLEGVASPEPVSQDDTVAMVAEEIEENTRDFVLKTLVQELKGHPLFHFVATC